MFTNEQPQPTQLPTNPPHQTPPPPATVMWTEIIYLLAILYNIFLFTIVSIATLWKLCHKPKQQLTKEEEEE